MPISAKTGLASTTCSRPSSSGSHRRSRTRAPLKALLIDSWYDTYRGVRRPRRIVDGVLKKGRRSPDVDRRQLSGSTHSPCSAPSRKEMMDALGPGEVGFFPRSGQSRKSPIRVWATPSPTHAIRPPRRFPASSRRSRWCSAACIRWKATTSPKLKRRPRPPATQRRRLRLFAPKVPGSGLWLPLRFPRPAFAHGNHPGAHPPRA